MLTSLQLLVLILLSLGALLAVYFFVEIDPKRRSSAAEQSVSSLPFVDKQLFSFSDKLRDCDTTLTSCGTDADCASQCITKNVCRQGTCKPEVSDTGDPPCDLSKGMVATFRYNEILGQYERRCLSTDPGIAVSNEVNNWCPGGAYRNNFNYLKAPPSVADCNCQYGLWKVPILGNINRRLNVSCRSRPLWRTLGTTRANNSK